jgi:hypothetical protein
MHDVVAAVAQQLVGIGRVAAAAELQEGINDIQGKRCRQACCLATNNLKRRAMVCTVLAVTLLLALTLGQCQLIACDAVSHTFCMFWAAAVVSAAGAINTLCTGGMFDRARLLAGSNPQLLQHIEQQHTQHLVENNDAEELAARGNAAAAVEMYAAQGNWKRAHELVRASNCSLLQLLSFCAIPVTAARP